MSSMASCAAPAFVPLAPCSPLVSSFSFRARPAITSTPYAVPRRARRTLYARLERRSVRTQERPSSSSSSSALRINREALELLYESAKSEEKQGNVDDAIRMYENLLEMDSTNGRAWLRYAMILRHRHKFPEARSVLMRALKANPTNAILWQNWADLEKSSGNIVAARRLFRKASEANDLLPSLYHSWGTMELRAGNVAAARRIFVQGLKKCPYATRLYHALGVLEDKHQNSRAARVILMRGSEIEPDNPYLHHAMGVLEYKAGNVPAARECFARATKVDPRHTLSWLSKAQLEEFEGNPDVARKHYAKGVTVGTNGAVQIWQAWARMEEKCGDFHAAIQLYERAVRFHPQDAMLYCSWGKLVQSRGDLMQARALYERGLEVDDTKAYLWQSLALLQNTLEGGDAARSIFAQGVEKSKGKEVAALLHAHAALEWEAQNVNEARELFRRAVEVDDSCGWLWLWLARFEVSQGNFGLAKHYIARSINAEPKDGAPWRVWAELERREGREDRARYMFRRAADLESSRDLYEIDPESPLRRPWRKF